MPSAPNLSTIFSGALWKRAEIMAFCWTLLREAIKDKEFRLSPKPPVSPNTWSVGHCVACGGFCERSHLSGLFQRHCQSWNNL